MLRKFEEAGGTLGRATTPAEFSSFIDQGHGDRDDGGESHRDTSRATSVPP